MKNQFRSLLSIATLVATTAAWSAEPPAPATSGLKVGVVPLVGHELTIVSREYAVGSNVDRNGRTARPLPNDSLQKAIVQAMVGAMAPGCSGCDFSLISPAQGWESIDSKIRQQEPSQLAEHLDVLVKPEVRSQFDRIVIIAPRRQRDFTSSNSTLAGIGYYVDSKRKIAGNQIAPYAYLQVALIDAKTGRVLAGESANNYRLFEDTVKKDTNPFEIVPPNELQDAFGNLVTDTMRTLGSRLVSSATAVN